MAPSLRLISERHVDQTRTLAANAAKAIWRLWAALKPEDWWDDTTTWGIAAQSSVLASSALQTARRQARSYAVRALMASGITTTTLPHVEEIYPRSGMLDVDVYRRPALVYRWETSQGRTDTAEDRARARLEALIRDDISTAQRRVETDTYRMSDKVIGWRRIIHPELSAGGTCGLCIAAADRIYSVRDLMPLHDRCNCLPASVTATSDPGLHLNEADLAALYALAGTTDTGDLSKIRLGAPSEAKPRENEPSTSPSAASGGGRDDGGNDGTKPPDDNFDAEGEPPYGEEWVRRQKALNISTGGEWLKIDEIDQLEHFQSLDPEVPLSEKIRWIPRDKSPGSLPTDDFEWTANGRIHVEMKRVHHAKYTSIHDAIGRTLIKLEKNHPSLIGTVKVNFMIDMGDRWLTDKLRWQLEKYNQRNPTRKIKRLWVLWKENLEEITLT